MRSLGKHTSRSSLTPSTMTRDFKHEWETYKEHELTRARERLASLGYALDDAQPHLAGERFLLSGRKLVLVGTRAEDGARVIIKVSSNATGAREIVHEHRLRTTLPTLPFSYRAFPAPEELLYEEKNGLTLAITAFIPEEKGFLEHDLREEFRLALDALKLQESVHAVAYGHTRAIRKVFGMMHAGDYTTAFACFAKEAREACPEDPALDKVFSRAAAFMTEHEATIEQYGDFLTHDDFVPHNLRVAGGTVYLLDYAALHFGNKYESWARFINFMVLYDRPLERALLEYVRRNRTPEEYLALRLMRVYKLGFLLKFYAQSAEKTEGDVAALARARIAFWTKVLDGVLDDSEVSDEVVRAYERERDSLRSEEEKARQRTLKQLS